MTQTTNTPDELKPKERQFIEHMFVSAIVDGENWDNFSIQEQLADFDLIEERPVDPATNEWEADKMWFLKDTTPNNPNDNDVERVARAIMPEVFKGTPEYTPGRSKISRMILQKTARTYAERAISAMPQERSGWREYESIWVVGEGLERDGSEPIAAFYDEADAREFIKSLKKRKPYFADLHRVPLPSPPIQHGAKP